MTVAADDTLAFASLTRPQLMRDFLERRRDAAYKALKVDRDPAGLHQAQGKAQLLDELLSLLEQSQKR